MVEFDEIKQSLTNMKPKINSLSEAVNVEELKGKIKNLEEKTSMPNFWDDTKESQKILSEISSLKAKVSNFEGLYNAYCDLCTLVDMANQEEDISLLDDVKSEYRQIKKELQSQTLSTLLTGEYDKNNAILTFHAGAGGTEAQDWVEMLYRMYCKWHVHFYVVCRNLYIYFITDFRHNFNRCKRGMSSPRRIKRRYSNKSVNPCLAF